MRKLLIAFYDFLKRSDMILLSLCVLSTLFGIVMIASATQYQGTNRYVLIQILAMLLGIGLYFLFSLIDLELLGEKWHILLAFSLLFISSLFIFGVAGDSGNRAWLRFGPIGIQPAEVVKIPFVIILARFMTNLRENRGLSKPFSLLQLCILFFMFFGLIIISSSDLGSALVYCFIFAVMLFVGGVKMYWFLIAAGGTIAIFPLAWKYFFSQNQKDRILALYDPSIDPTGLGITWQTNQSKSAIASGQFFGQGLFNGNKTSIGSIPQQHTDFIFSVTGEELGFIGCAVIIILLLLIIIRCVYVGVKSNNYTNMLVCIGIASMLIFQMLENIGMCLGLTPVIGLTLPFFSYGGSSIVTLYAAMGIISGIKLRPKPNRFYML